MQETCALQVQLRKAQDTLKIAGQGVIAFGLWSTAKSVLYSMLQWDSIVEKTMMDAEHARTFAVVAYIVVMAIILGFEIMIRLYIGRSAVSESRGKRKNSAYIVLALTLSTLSLTFLIIAALISEGAASPVDYAKSIVVEATSVFTSLELCTSAIRIRKLRKQMAGEG